MSRFPKLTETFILDELVAVDRQGLRVELFPLLRESGGVVAADFDLDRNARRLISLCRGAAAA
jgi:hypothetical protein